MTNKSTFLATSLALALASCLSVKAASDTKLTEPYNPKPSGECPSGWEIQILEGSQIDNSTTLNNKRVVKVTVPAYELVASKPKDGGPITVLRDPGFDPKLANAQKDTVGATLTSYSEQTSALSEKLDKIITSLKKDLGDIPASGSLQASSPTPKPTPVKAPEVLTNDNTPSPSPSASAKPDPKRQYHKEKSFKPQP